MKKILIILSSVIVFTLTSRSVFAYEVRTSSAKLADGISVEKDYSLDVRARAVRNVFKKYNSPLVDQATIFVKYADEFGVDWKLLPSIAGLESTFGKFLIPGSYNAYGWGGGRIYFDSWEDGIRIINKALRQNYLDRGAETVWSIGPIYAESPTWSVRVNQFMTEVEEEYRKLFLLSMTSTI